MFFPSYSLFCILMTVSLCKYKRSYPCCARDNSHNYTGYLPACFLAVANQFQYEQRNYCSYTAACYGKPPAYGSLFSSFIISGSYLGAKSIVGNFKARKKYAKQYGKN